MKESILLTGATGLLGGMCLWRWHNEGLAVTALVRDPDALPPNAWPGVELCHGDLEEPNSLTRAVKTVQPRLVVHCAGLTKVDQCQHEPRLTRAVNEIGSGALAAAANKYGSAMVHISTDAVYAQGPGPHSEADQKGELSAYATSKLAGEQVVAAAHPKALVLRTCMLGWNQNTERGSLGEWIVATLRSGQELPGFTDVRFSPLFTGTLAGLILRGARAGLSGVYNLGSNDGLSKYETARLIAEKLGLDPGLVRPTKQSQIKLAIPRPEDPVMDSSRFYSAIGEKAPSISQEVQAMLDMEDTGELLGFRRFGGY